MKMALNGKNKFGYIDGSFPCPETDDSRSKSLWKRNDQMVCSWLLNAVSKDIVASIVYDASAVEIWSDLRNQFQQVNGPHTYQLRKDLVGLSQGSIPIIIYREILIKVWPN